MSVRLANDDPENGVLIRVLSLFARLEVCSLLGLKLLLLFTSRLLSMNRVRVHVV